MRAQDLRVTGGDVFYFAVDGALKNREREN